ncbi:trihelix transcription factor PTL [Argentina anserina]|uniref:trihelix transcription factor PTL n=1 Tax=Argentina anserina TaxID=57926 RepID=UPI0021766A15|nr:trihelix transcription factor PTL [Potentilla anserina]
MEMEDQYGLGDLRQLMSGTGRSHFPAIPTPAELFPSSHNHRPQLLAPANHHHHHHHHQQHPYEIMMMGRLPTTHDIMPRGFHEFRSADSAGGGSGGACINNTVAATSSLSGGGCQEAEGAGCLGGDAGSGRWPRQETLTLLEIRSRLDYKFKEANQKGPLWDEVSRIMSEEHGYQRSGKKCREKFENLYKYYKKTKEGKAGRQDGKHYRFFRQLEALYGETSNNVAGSSLPPDQSQFVGNNNNMNNNNNTFRYQAQPSHQHTTTATTYQSTQSVSNSSDFDDSSSSEDNNVSAIAPMDDDMLEMKRVRKRRGWKVKIKEFIDVQMRKMMEKQEEWLEKLMSTLEQKERERVLREDEWRKQEAGRVEREQQFWAKERAWIESRDKTLMEALHKLTASSTSHEIKTSSSTPEQDHEDIVSEQRIWPEFEVNRLVQLRGSMESRFSTNQRGGCADDILWEEIAGKLSCLGYERSGMVCKEKWESINCGKMCSKDLFSKKRKENNSRSSSCFFGNNESNSSLYSSQGGVYATCQMNNHERVDNGSPPTNPNVGNAAVVNETCFPFLMGEGDNLWENYGLKLNNGSQNQ